MFFVPEQEELKIEKVSALASFFKERGRKIHRTYIEAQMTSIIKTHEG